MIEINNENKAKFFAQYWGQTLFIERPNNQFPMAIIGIDIDMGVHVFDNGLKFRSYYHIDEGALLLKPLSSISDEDASKIAKLYGWEESNPAYDDRVLQFKIDLACIAIKGYLHKHLYWIFDLLRSKGYALPWMDLSVEKMVEAGWIKLKED